MPSDPPAQPPAPAPATSGVGEMAEAAPAAENMHRTALSWWGSYQIGQHRQGKWHIGPLILWLQRLPYEWRVATQMLAEDAYDPGAMADIAAPGSIETLPAQAEVFRFAATHPSEAAGLLPMLADRAVVTKTEHPLYVFAGEEVTLYLSYPVWVRIDAGDPPRVLHEAPVYRLSDTWFGSNPREGELCYASRTFGRLDLKQVPRRPYRAIGAVKLRNRGSDALLVERINTPLPLLSLYQDEDGQLWTNTQVIERAELGKPISYEVERNAPEQARHARLLMGPRQHAEQRSALQRAFDSFVG